MQQPKLIIMAGGTGGHVFPGLAVAQHMSKQGWQVDWLGTKNHMEADLVPKYGFPIHFIDIGGLRGKSLITKLLTPVRLFKALLQALKLFKSIRPNAVLGMGGYASGPGGIAAKLLSVPLIIHEQNAVFGLTNRYLGKIANGCLTGFDFSQLPTSHKRLPTNLTYVGNPIRQGFFELTDKSTKHVGENLSSVNILIVGGSLGALALNQIVPAIIQKLKNELPNKSIHTLHQSGKSKASLVNTAYAGTNQVEVIEFIDNMIDAFDWADIIICRAGALTVAEVAGAGRAAIFVPLPIAVDDHQTVNAQYLSKQGGAVLIQQSKLENELYNQLFTLITQPDTRKTIATTAKRFANQDATEKVCAAILQLSQLEAQSQTQKEGL